MKGLITDTYLYIYILATEAITTTIPAICFYVKAILKHSIYSSIILYHSLS